MRSAAIMVALLAFAIHAHVAAAQSNTTGSAAILDGCQDAFAPITASASEVRVYLRHLDAKRYRIFGEGLGVATLAVRIFACDSLAVPGSRPRPTLGAQFGVTLESPDATGRVFGTDACCNWYTFFWVTDNRDFAAWLKDGTGLRGVVHHVKDLVYRRRPSFGAATAAIYFAAREPTPSPFELEATILTPQDPWLRQEISPNWWAETRKGTIRVTNHVPRFRPYQALGEIRTRAGTQMAKLFHGTTKPFGSPVSFGRWDHSVTTRTVSRSGGRAQRRTMIHTAVAANAS